MHANFRERSFPLYFFLSVVFAVAETRVDLIDISEKRLFIINWMNYEFLV